MSDSERIRREIQTKIEAVDYAIQVLLSAGMSSPALREIAAAGVDIEYAAYSEIAAAIIFLGPFQLLTIAHVTLDLIYLRAIWSIAVLQGLSVVGRLTLIVLIFRSSTDQRCFLLKAVTKLAALALGLCLAMLLLSIYIFVPVNDFTLAWLSFIDIGTLCLVPLGLIGIRGTSQLPCGRRLLQLFFARGAKALLACYCGPCCRPSKDVEDEDEDEYSESD